MRDRLSQLYVLFAFLGCLWLSGCKFSEPETNRLQQILQRGELRIGTIYGATTYYQGPRGDEGFEFELAREFANYLGVRLSVQPSSHVDLLFDQLENHELDLLAAGLTISPQRQEKFRFSPQYDYVSQKLVFKKGRPWPRNWQKLNGELVVSSASVHEEILENLRHEYPELNWRTAFATDQESLLLQMLDNEIDYTIVDDNLLDGFRRFHPEVSIAFSVTDESPVAWAIAREDDDSLYAAMLEFFAQVQNSGRLTQLLDQYYGHIEEFDYVDTRSFIRSAKSKLPKYKELFRKYAGEFDWRLLAAVSYQESHWNPNARSRTGVRGLMMLTLPTADLVGVSNRLDPEQSIRGGSRYLAQLLKRIPDKVPEDQKIWFALAAYNVGLGHLLDAADITQMRGGNRYQWVDVKESLPLLRKREWYRKTKYGYARGNEPVRYITNIRRYYETLVWLDNQEQQQRRMQEQQLAIPGVSRPAVPIQIVEESLQQSAENATGKINDPVPPRASPDTPE